LQTIDEIIQLRCLESEVTEIDLYSLSHDVSADKDIYLFQEACTLSVADLVIIVDCVVGMVNCDLNGMRGSLGIII
jgi:hypothetical protein